MTAWVAKKVAFAPRPGSHKSRRENALAPLRSNSAIFVLLTKKDFAKPNDEQLIETKLGLFVTRKGP